MMLGNILIVFFSKQSKRDYGMSYLILNMKWKSKGLNKGDETMKYNPYYNKSTMNLKQLARDLEKQGFACKISEDGDYLCVYYLCFLDYVEIDLTGYMDWSVTYYRPYKTTEFYRASTNWEVVKLLKKLLIEA